MLLLNWNNINVQRVAWARASPLSWNTHKYHCTIIFLWIYGFKFNFISLLSHFLWKHFNWLTLSHKCLPIVEDLWSTLTFLFFHLFFLPFQELFNGAFKSLINYLITNFIIKKFKFKSRPHHLSFPFDFFENNINPFS